MTKHEEKRMMDQEIYEAGASAVSNSSADPQAKTIENDPTIRCRTGGSSRKTVEADPAIRRRTGESSRKTFEADPAIRRRTGGSSRRTFENDPAIRRGTGRRRSGSNRNRTIIAVLMAMILAFSFSACSGAGSSGNDQGSSAGGSSQSADGSGGSTGSHGLFEKEPEPEIADINILCSGDLVMHMPVINAASTSDGYNFTGSFKYIKKYIQEADVSFVSLEAPLAEDNFTGYPLFRCPADLADSLKDVGYDVVLMSSNHTNDGGEEGIFRTIDILNEAGLEAAGSRKDPEEPRYTMVDARGVKVAIVSYVYASGQKGSRDLNGNPMTDASEEAVNSFTYETFDSDVIEIRDTVAEARQAGADIVVMYYHWGEEYQLHSNEHQQRIAQMTANEADVDIIVGSHPHVPQERAVIDRNAPDADESGSTEDADADGNTAGTAGTEEGVSTADTDEDGSTEDTDNDGNTADTDEDGSIEDADADGSTADTDEVRDQVEVYYAMGNLLSNQNRDTLGDRHTEEGYLVDIDVSYNLTDDKLVSMESHAIPYFLDITGYDTRKYRIIPLEEGFEDNETIVNAGHQDKAKQALEDVEKILEGNP